MSATKISHGNGLTQTTGGPSGGSWVFRYKAPDGRRRELGLGTVAAVSLLDAQTKVRAMHRQLKAGVDPLEHRDAERTAAKATRAKAASAADTFDTLAAQFIADNKAAWRNAKHGQQWQNTLAKYASPVIGSKRAADVTVADVLAILRPIWSEKPETASRVRSRIELVLASADGSETRLNPAARAVVARRLPKASKVRTVRHHPALPAARVQDFWHELRAMPGTGARALQFAILTAARSGEVRGMTWAEVSWPDALWTVPAARMKAGRQHRVPLPPAAIELLEAARAGRTVRRDELVFPGADGKAPLSDMTLAAVVKRMNADNAEPWLDVHGETITPHGFRSTFRDWVAESTDFPGELAEAALAHVVGDKVEAAYRRGDQLAKRRELMTAWADHLLGGDLV
jgi:integrase